LEGLFAETKQSFRKYGYWAAVWMRLRRADSLISVVVLDDFIRERLITSFSDKLRSGNVVVIHHPLTAINGRVNGDSADVVFAFVGYRTRFKGFEDFVRVASQFPSTSSRFLAIGAGKVENVQTGAVRSLERDGDYFEELTKCRVALFLYGSGYTCSLSAAAIDALSAGLVIVALDRPFFRSLASYFGMDIVRVYSSVDAVRDDLLSFAGVANAESRATRLNRAARSKYGSRAVQRSFERVLGCVQG
jgi:hypothetical protein